MRREPAFLDDIVRSGDSIKAICTSHDLGTLLKDDVAQAAILHHLAVMGEAANRVSEELRSQYPEIPWSRIVSQRNRVVHDYFGLDWVMLWKTIAEDLPRVCEQVRRILETKFPEKLGTD